MPGRFPPPPDSNVPQWGDRPQPNFYPLDVSRLWSMTMSIFRFRWKTFVGMSLLIMAPAWVLLAAVDLVVGNPSSWYEEFTDIARAGGSIDLLLPRILTQIGLDLAVGAIGGIAIYFATGAIARAAADVYSGAPASAGRAVRYSLSRFGTFIAMWTITFLITAAIVAIGVFVGTALFLVTATGGRVLPGPTVFFGLIVFVTAFVAIMFVTIRFAMAVPTAVLEDAGATTSLRRSWYLVSGSTWRVLGYTLLFAIVLGLIGGLLSLVVTLIVNPFRFVGTTVMLVDPGRLAVSTLVTGLITAALMPISTIGMTLLYLDLRWRKGEKVPLPGQAQTAAPSPEVPVS
jgi:hypothetical protein